jgi:hypothetical protein
MGIYKFGNNTYPRRIRRRSNLGHIFLGGKSASYGPGNTVLSWEMCPGSKFNPFASTNLGQTIPPPHDIQRLNQKMVQESQ